MNHTTKMKAWWIVLAIAIALVAIFLSSGCVTTQPVPDTRPSYYQLAKQAQQMTNVKQ